MFISKKTTETSTTFNHDAKVNRFFIIDCSGSMSSDLAQIRTQMKNKIPQLTNIGDTITIIWFSSKGQFGALQEGLEINSVTDFKGMNAAIDKFIRPVGCTGFKDPIDLSRTISLKLKNAHKDSYSQLFMMTDGYDNEWNQGEIIKSTTNLADTFDSVTFVEYGWYCNRALMTKMAESIGASLIFSKSFDEYDGQFELNIKKKVKSSKRKTVDVGTSDLQFAFAKDGDDVVSFIVDNGKVTVPDHIKDIYFFSPSNSSIDAEGKYVAIYTLAQRMMGNEVLEILGELGDVYFIDKFNNCFSKQDYSEFQSEIKEAISDPSKRYSKGMDASYLPAADAPTIIDLLDTLANDNVKFHPYDPQFKYERISAARLNASENITSSEKEELMEKLKNATSIGDVKVIGDAIAELEKGKVSVKFSPNGDNLGYPISSLTFAEDRPNISVLIRVDGTVTLPQNSFNLPEKFPTFIFRNYAMVKDGIKHSSTNCLPLELSQSSFDYCKSLGLVDAFESRKAGKIYYINANLPVVNRHMATSVSAITFFDNVIKLQSLKSAQKVYKSFSKGVSEKKSEGFETLYGAEATAWLKELGITEYNGFSPKTISAEPQDVYMAKEFGVSIAKCSSIPKIDDKLIEKVKSNGKLTPLEALCRPAVSSYQTLLESGIYKNSSDKDALLKTWLESETKNAVKSVRNLIRETAKTKFAIMVGHTWFKEFSSLDENSMTVKLDGIDYVCTAELKDIEVKI